MNGYCGCLFSRVRQLISTGIREINSVYSKKSTDLCDFVASSRFVAVILCQVRFVRLIDVIKGVLLAAFKRCADRMNSVTE